MTALPPPQGRDPVTQRTVVVTGASDGIGAAAARALASATHRPGVDGESGRYHEKRRVSRTNPQVSDQGLATRLWERSAAMVGITPA